MAAERKAEGRSASATIRRIGAENIRRESSIVMRKKSVLIHLGIASAAAALLSFFSSLENRIAAAGALTACVCVCCDSEREGEKGGKREKVRGKRGRWRN